jgi:hypothetical protein
MEADERLSVVPLPKKIGEKKQKGRRKGQRTSVKFKVPGILIQVLMLYTLEQILWMCLLG